MAPRDPRDLPALELADRLRRGRPTVVAHSSAVLDRIAERDPHLVAFAEVTGAAALADAARLDALPAADRDRMPLFGVPVAVKSELDVAGVVTRFGGAGNSTPAGADAEVVRRVRAAGAVVVGVTTSRSSGRPPSRRGRGARR